MADETQGTPLDTDADNVPDATIAPGNADPRQPAPAGRVNPVAWDNETEAAPDPGEITADTLRTALGVMRVLNLARHPETRGRLYDLADEHGVDASEIDQLTADQVQSPEVARLNADPAYQPRDIQPSQYPGSGPSRTPGTRPAR